MRAGKTGFYKIGLSAGEHSGASQAQGPLACCLRSSDPCTHNHLIQKLKGLESHVLSEVAGSCAQHNMGRVTQSQNTGGQRTLDQSRCSSATYA